ncbi:uncharacterized protein LOC135210740 [Macrobrachium nipponense]|uniref:uncharacterized protein LOC135210740 n=1 Tax=Macrobrachium nipponense TaxID=159736 RepID=UPI0030C80DCD
MNGKYFGHVRQSTTLFPQRVCISSEPAISEEPEDLVGNPVSSEKQKFLLEQLQEATVKSQESDNGLYENIGESGYRDALLSVINKGFSDPELVRCFVCKADIASEYLSKHLLLGQVKCMSCSAIIKRCQTFHVWSLKRNTGSACDHMLYYLNDPWETLRMYYATGLNRSSPSVAGLIESKMSTYLHGIKSLRYRYPWKQVFSHSVEQTSLFEIPKMSKGGLNEAVVASANDSNPSASGNDCYPRTPFGENVMREKLYLDVGHELQRNGVLTSGGNPVKYSGVQGSKENSCEAKVLVNNLKDNSLRKHNGSKGNGASFEKKYHCAKKSTAHLLKVKSRAKSRHVESERKVLVSQSKNSTELVAMPSNGFYFIAKHSLKECPNCYAVIRPQDFSVNIVTFLMTAICSDCGLTMYVVQDTPDDECPRICIVGDKDPIIKNP